MGTVLIILFAAPGMLRRILPLRDERIEPAFRSRKHPLGGFPPRVCPLM